MLNQVLIGLALPFSWLKQHKQSYELFVTGNKKMKPSHTDMTLAGQIF
ncbi:hypothetical protein RFK95_01940 [Acinetobacter pittii]|uniref:Transposase n=1 Tax=Acinetobacter pittii TaxID=48296 RepID=A0AB37TEU3_ACIPI|nr:MULTISPECIES: hypothetical protein [Acinetobacter]MBM0875930.1 hypothetical protein [Acinetobacter pittii]MCK0923888.1 hypothetical protein [Acinetobacter pittii]MCU4618252.1 hypothetical protein [Acinetobacter pittii]MDA3452607.1 hypothetical protein [Acinetobacter sp. AOR43_HL]MDQ8856256.1 hypothetical protein [Acinetobacter pittii]